MSKGILSKTAVAGKKIRPMPPVGKRDTFRDAGHTWIWIDDGAAWVNEQLESTPRPGGGKPFTVSDRTMQDYCDRRVGCLALGGRAFVPRKGYVERENTAGVCPGSRSIFERRYLKLADLAALAEAIKALYRAEAVPLSGRPRLILAEVRREFPSFGREFVELYGEKPHPELGRPIGTDWETRLDGQGRVRWCRVYLRSDLAELHAKLKERKHKAVGHRLSTEEASIVTGLDPSEIQSEVRAGRLPFTRVRRPAVRFTRTVRTFDPVDLARTKARRAAGRTPVQFAPDGRFLPGSGKYADPPNESQSSDGMEQLRKEKQTRRPGRRSDPEAKHRAYRQLVAEWERARDAGQNKKEFAADRGRTVAEVDRARVWVARYAATPL